MKYKICENCKKEKEARKIKSIFIEMDNDYSLWCNACRLCYRQDTKIILKRSQ
jgi:hypothetical protein